MPPYPAVRGTCLAGPSSLQTYPVRSDTDGVSAEEPTLPSEDIDPQMWIGGRLAPVVTTWSRGNPHTFPGRMEAYCPHLNGGTYLTISTDEILRLLH